MAMSCPVAVVRGPCHGSCIHSSFSRFRRTGNLPAKAYERAKVLVETMTRQRWMAMGSRTGGSGSAKSADGSRRAYRAVKRVFDVVGAIIVAPALSLVALTIVSHSGGHSGHADTCG